MAAFANMEAAETRAKTKTADGTWIMAHSARNATGTIAVRVQRKIDISAATGYGTWAELTDDGHT